MNSKKKGCSDLIDFLKLCAIEQTGNHTITFGIGNNFVEADQSVLKFIVQLKDILLNLSDNNEEQMNFLNRFNSINLENLSWCQERDCQIFETGNHIVNLCFKLHLDDNDYLINLMVVFQQQFNEFPKDAKNINIVLTKDQIYLINDENVNIISQNQKKSRRKIKTSVYSFDSEIVEKIDLYLPSLFKSSSEYQQNPKLQPDACLIS